MIVTVDPEFARASIALHEAAQLLIYLVALQMTREAQGSGSVDTRELVETLHAAGVTATTGTLRRWLLKGDGVYWTLHGKRLYLYGMAHLTTRGAKGRLNITQRAIDAIKPEIVMTNPAGANLVELTIPPTIREFTAQVYRAWFVSRGDHTRLISRYTLGMLWNVTRKTLQGWERLAGIRHTDSYAQYRDRADAPDHNDPYLISTDTRNVYEIMRFKARYSNQYHAPTLRELPRTRSDQQRRQAALRLVQTSDGSFPTRVFGAGMTVNLRYLGGFRVTGRLTFDDPKGEAAALKRVRQHLRKHQDYDTPHFVMKGHDRHGRIILERTNGAALHTGIDEQLPRRVADPIFPTLGGRVRWRTGAAA